MADTDTTLGKIWEIVDDTAKSRKVEALVKELIASKEHEARLNCLEELLDWQDQETDLDGRATGEPYYVISGDGARHNIEQEIAALRGEAPASEELQGDSEGLSGAQATLNQVDNLRPESAPEEER